MNRKLFENRVRPPDKHPTVPVVAAGFDISVGRRLVGLFFERLHLIRAFESIELLAAMNVTQTRVAEGRNNSECDERFRLLRDDIERGAQTGLKCINRLDDMIGGDDREDGILVALEQ